MFKFNRIRWALRKVRLPIKGDALVLDVGAGGNPYPRSDILLDRLTGDAHRCGESMLIDRLAVFGDASKMPFKDKAFDFVIASHILEHMAEPEVFLKELQRVGKAGYIETPNALFERLYPYDIHCLEILEKNGVLHIHKKNQPIEDPFLGAKQILMDGTKWAELMHINPHLFHVQYFWSDEIKYEIDNPSTSCDWIEKINANSVEGVIKNGYLDDESGWRDIGLSVLNLLYKIRRKVRLKNFKLLSILACPSCGGVFVSEEGFLKCNCCSAKFSYQNGIPDFTKNLKAASDAENFS